MVRQPIPYLEPTGHKSTNNHKSNDCDSIPMLHIQNPIQDYETLEEAPYQVLEGTNQTITPVYESVIKEDVVYDTLSCNEQIYEDPGHKREVIYSWFEKMKFRMIKKEDIRYSSITTIIYIQAMLEYTD